ncbi:DUF58 domain-containing protein [Salinispora arenicola]|uniref:Uncharacterized protein (DUF58 family) n=1 Tax=Salinispora arenicola TaxID=168697 RepID=A0A542XQI5_SALAC|nr:DUF58 domain-containing protein [Salinispora arenicola]MCN0179979.1 DUF58 domain-containing protein [Salinispora arenicola]NIL63798.1 DUF58 domain-containing protein [Salinispora arenicola]TQL38115.1 uncharacterized protein (DUF58 family) [Salinispora arenicola]GIM86627.1 hypothetical protein Sar04_33630 [Salinispora arenicola]
MGVTARGVGLFVAAGVLLAAGFRFAYPELALLGAAGATAGGYAVAVAAWRPRLAVVRRAEPDRVARGEPATMTVTVHNRGRLRSANLVAEDRCGAVPVAVPVLRLRPGRDTTVRYDVPTTRRGVVPVGPLRVIRRDPLGLVSLSRPYGETVPVWVHPRVHPLSVVPTGAGRSLDGQVDAVPHGSITFDSLREYVVGDELRRVHWRTSARVGELMVRENVDTSLPRLVVLLDNRAVAHPQRSAGLAESFEAACEAAASVLTAAHRSDLPVVLVLVAPEDEGSRAGVAESEAARSGLSPLDRLAAAGLGGDTLDATLTRLRGERRGDTLVALTGPGGRDSLGQFGALRGAYPSVVVGVLAAAEPAQAQTAGLVVIDAADGAAFAAEWDRVRRW